MRQFVVFLFFGDNFLDPYADFKTLHRLIRFKDHFYNNNGFLPAPPPSQLQPTVPFALVRYNAT